MTATTSGPGNACSASSNSPIPRWHCRFKSAALQDTYRGVTEAAFGCVTVSLPNGSSYQVRDLQYWLPDQRLGMHLVPVSDHGSVELGSVVVSGASLVDDLLRSRMGLHERDPIYAIAAYIRPEEHSLGLRQLPRTTKLFHGYKHLAAYIGDGKTTHSPERHHADAWQQTGHNVWQVAGYPATVFVLSLEGVDQKIVNRNARIVDAILNDGALAPANFERMQCRASTLNTALQFYRDWIRKEEYLTDLSWHMSCSDHKAVVLNVALNLPHNSQAFQQVFGDDGTRLWSDFLRRYRGAVGREFLPADETHFQPLWQKEKIDVREIHPLSLAEQNAFDAAVMERRLDRFTGRRPLPPGTGMAWRMETPADLLYDFAATYIRFADAGGVYSSAVLARLAAQAPSRLGIPERTFCSIMQPLISKLLVADAFQNARRDTPWLAEARQIFREFLVAAPDELENDYWTSDRADKFADQCFSDVVTKLPSLAGATETSIDVALRTTLLELGQLARELRDDTASRLFASRFFTSPSIFHRIALGTHPCSRFVGITPVCTVVDHTEATLELSDVPASESSRAEPMAHSASLDHRSCARSPRRVLPKDNTEAFERSVFRSEPSLVYAVGELGYDFGSDAVRDAFEHQMCPRSKTRANPDDVRELAEFLSRVRGKEPWHAASLLWTLKMNDAILYVVRPDGPFADEGYKRLCQSLLVRLCGTAVRIVVPGTITAEARLLNGQSVPVVTPDLRGLRTWTIQALDAVASVPVSRDDKDSNDAAPRFWDRVSHELRNEGLRPEDRALNFALTDIFENHSVPAAFGSKGVLDTIDVEKSAICRTGSDCWNVTLAFFAPAQPAQMVRQIYSCTIDVSQSLPVIVGSVRLWKTRARSVDSSRGRVDAFRP